MCFKSNRLCAPSACYYFTCRGYIVYLGMLVCSKMVTHRVCFRESLKYQSIYLYGQLNHPGFTLGPALFFWIMVQDMLVQSLWVVLAFFVPVYFLCCISVLTAFTCPAVASRYVMWSLFIFFFFWWAWSDFLEAGTWLSFLAYSCFPFLAYGNGFMNFFFHSALLQSTMQLDYK
jgi:hypothetical protein